MKIENRAFCISYQLLTFIVQQAKVGRTVTMILISYHRHSLSILSLGEFPDFMVLLLR